MEQDIINNRGKLSSKKSNFLFPFFLYFFSFLLLLAPIAPAIIPFTIAYISASLLFIFICWFIFKTDIDPKYINTFVLVSLLVRTAVIFIPPAGSDDYTRYVWDGKVLANGINPYQYAPSDSALNHLHSGKLPALVKFPEVKTVYPPAAEIFFYFAYLIGGESFYGMKVLLMIFELLSFFVIIKLIKGFNLPDKNILYYALCPLPIFHLFIDAHVDGLGASLLLLFILFYFNKNYLLSSLFLGLSICVKPVGLIVLPIIFFHQKGFIKKITVSSIPLILCIFFYFFFSRNVNPLEALGNFAVNWTYNGFIFNIIDSFIKDNQKSRTICAAIFVLSFLPLLFSKKDFIKKIYYAVLLLFIFSPIVHPWYVSWLAVLLPLGAEFSGFVYCGLISLTSITILNYQMYGKWIDYPVVWFMEYLPVLFFLVYEFFAQAKSREKIEKAVSG
ncbi:MAG TPA: hypothetical protein VMT35_03220 [Ignavibacteriaceae bacterium]|nr:hypothetical protein [Ignavibacteriaceae bacterium]